jgi:inosine-uridine nucleoside N-ribohydrolase
MKEDEKPKLTDRREFLKTSSGVAVAGMLGNFAVREHGGPSSEPVRIPFSSAALAPRRIILDTDPGIDDAMAILLTLRSPELKVEAITPVAGNVPLEFTLPNALRLVEIAGRTDIPVAAGASVPLVRRLVTATHAHGENGLGGVEFPAPSIKPVKETATEIIRRIVRGSPGEISIVAIGPLTNIATALRVDPDLAAMVPAIVLMGGSLSGGNVTPAAEFNFYVDPEAALIVFHSGIPITMVGLDVTRKVQLREEHVVALEAGKNPSSQAAGRIMRGTMERYRKTGFPGGPTMHDPLALASMIDPAVVTLQDYFVDIETSGEITAGESVGYRRMPMRHSAPLDSDAPINAAAPTTDEIFKPNANVAVDVDPERFFRLLISRLAA